MEINNLLKDVINLNEYISATQDVRNKFKHFNVAINSATVLTLKKIRSLEIEYLNKFNENGVACIIFERLLTIPPSKVWGLLAKELVYLLQYWLEAIRKHLVNHSPHWWMFLKLILKFIKELRLKEPSIPNMLVELTADCLFDLATSPRPDVYQHYEILHCFNMVCAESSREIRFAMRTKFGEYFVKIASQMATSGFLPAQYGALECLMRWLVPRKEGAQRAAAAERWLPESLCPPAAKNLFLNSSWMNFFQDARDFLNALNEGNGLVKSVICRRLCIGEVVIINGTEKQQSWLDFNTSGRSVSVILDPRVLEVFGVKEHRACETLMVDDIITETAILHRESLGLTISIHTHRPPHLLPSALSPGSGRFLTAVVSSRTNLRVLDDAMRNTFGDKYQLHVDLDSEISQSPQRSYINERNAEEDTRFSHPIEVKRRKHTGYILKSKYTGGAISPSTASTSSLIQLKDKLAALPRHKFDKEPVSVCAQPALSNVTELTEQDDRSIYTSTTDKFQPYGVCQRRFKTRINQVTECKSRSDGETVKRKSRGGRGLLSPVVSDDNATSLLLVATVGSTNDSVINETIERLSKFKDFQDDNIVDLLIQEAMQAKPKSREVSDSSISTDEKKSQESETIEDTPNEIREFRSRVPPKKVCKVISKSTTDDESNTETINETPAYVNTRKVRGSSNPKPIEAERTYNVKSVDEFFSQHIAENRREEIVISPTLAKKINKTSSETSDNFDDEYLFMNDDVNTDVEQSIFNDIAVFDCLNDMVDKVCSDFDKCTEYLFKETTKLVKITKNTETDAMEEDNYRTPKSKPSIEKPKRNIKLKYKPVKKSCVTKKAKIAEQEKIAKMSTIVEQTEEDTIPEEINPASDIENMVNVDDNAVNPETPCSKDIETPIRRRKRKLYSPKDDDIEKEVKEITTDKTSDDIPLAEIKSRKYTKTTAACYKELERERKKYTRVPKSRKSKAKDIEMPSPRTIKMNSMFDYLKQTVESNENITLVDRNTDVYNFTSESEDDDFKKKVEIKKRVNTESVVKKGRNARRNKETDSSYEEIKAKPKRKKVTKSKKNTEAKVPVVGLVGDKLDLVDEKMRDAVTEQLNTSIVIEKHIDLESIEAGPALIERPRMEEIFERVSNDTLVSKIAKKTPVVKHASESNDTMLSNTTKELTYESASNDAIYPKIINTKRAKKTEVVQIQDDKSNNTLSTKKKVNKRGNKKTEILQIKKEKGLAKKDKAINDKDDDSLPGLVVESMPKQKKDLYDSYITLHSNNMLQKFKRIYKDGSEVINDSVNTQNMLSDVERFNQSAYNYTTDEIYFENDKENVDAEKQKKIQLKTTQVCTKIAENDEIETIHTDQSEGCIASDDINAHGDLDEAPPNPETIKEELQPRELQDLDQSMRDYFNRLTREIHNTTKNDAAEEKRNEDKNKSAISPIVSVKRLSFEDIRKWMPSRRTSDTDSSQTSKVSQTKTNKTPRRQIEINISNETTPKSEKTKVVETSTPETKSPVVSITRMSLEELDKWLPMPCFKPEKKTVYQNPSDLKLVYRTRSKSKAETSPITQKDKSKTKATKAIVTTDSDSDDTNDTHFKKPIRKDSYEDRTKKAPSNITSPVKSATPKRKTIDFEERSDRNTLFKTQRSVSKDTASPVKTMEKSKPEISPIKLNSNNENSSDDEVIKKIRRIFSKVNSQKSNVNESMKRKSTSPILSENKKRPVKLDTDVYELESNESKKIEVLEDIVISESGPSIASVNDWFRKAVPTSRRDKTSMSYKDALHVILEKLDTTLPEINENTSKMFRNLFMEVQKQLSENKVEHRQLMKKVASDIITVMLSSLNDKFAEFDMKSQEMDTNFMENLKQKALELVRADCEQKRAMVLMLKEDVQAVMDHIERHSTHSD